MNTLLSKTGACHRFFCVGLLCVWGICAVNLSAQIVLQDVEAVEDTVALQPEPQSPVRTQDVEALIQQMNNTRMQPVSRVSASTTEAWQVQMDAVQAKFGEPDARFKVRASLAHGEEVLGELKNRCFQVKNDVGVFAVILQELSSIEAMGESGIFELGFASGDQLLGEIEDVQFPLQLASGGYRVVSVHEIKKIEFIPTLK